MKALIWTAPQQMDYLDVETPELLPGEALLRVQSVGICGSEIEGYLGHNSLRVPPLVMGHEFCGTVEQVGDGVSPDWLEQKVVVNPLLYCGNCPSCRKGLTNLCQSRRIIGIHRPGGFAEWVAVPAKSLVAVPSEMKTERAALAEPLACSLRATRRAMLRHPFANVLVFGAGGIGLLCAKIAKLLGASTVIVADTNAERLNVALRNGADRIVNPKEDGMPSLIQSFAGDKGIDVVIDAAGFQQTREISLELINPGGTFMNIGLGIDVTDLRINHLIRSEIEILGSFCYTDQDFQDAMNLLSAGTVTGNGWTEKRSLRDGWQAFAELTAGKVLSGKIILIP
jgi:threonine dehydrogenase-like Zn-dependent dehydrogenase